MTDNADDTSATDKELGAAETAIEDLTTKLVEALSLYELTRDEVRKLEERAEDTAHLRAEVKRLNDLVATVCRHCNMLRAENQVLRRTLEKKTGST